jgi:hypothetical protein
MPPEIKAMVFFFIIIIPFCDMAVESRYAANVVARRGTHACDMLQFLCGRLI